MKKSGEITVFLVLILLVVSAFIIELLNLEHHFTSASEAQYATDVAVRSCFAEYNRELYERSHILLVDSSYRSSECGIERVKSHFIMYLDGNISQNRICSVEISEYKNAEDLDYQYMFDSAVRYARSCPGPPFSTDTDDNCFLSYLQIVFGNSHDPSDGCVREGEIEYLIFGRESDYDNITAGAEDYAQYEDEGWEYEDFLRDRLEEVGMYTLKHRYVDLVTEYMRMNGSPGFDPGTGYYDITFEIGLKGVTMGESYISRRYAYDQSEI